MRQEDRELYFGDFERDGEDVVRTNLSLKRYAVRRAFLARQWLDEREAERSESSQAEQLSIARSAKDAAWEAAWAAQTANTIAKAALAIAIVAAIIAISALFIGPKP